MDEARKTNAVRGADFARRYLAGKVIDIGAGRDLVCASAERFDLQDGDANIIAQLRPAGHYDTVHSSHCLEHMHDPRAALAQWWALVKGGGHLVVVVPDEDLYEQGIWPSLFNRDHKLTFRLDRPASWSPVSFDIRELVAGLPGSEIISAEVHDMHYDHSLRMTFGAPRRQRIGWLRLLRKLGMHVPLFGMRLKHHFENMAARRGVPLDQTMRNALAQIQVVVRKRTAAD